MNPCPLRLAVLAFVLALLRLTTTVTLAVPAPLKIACVGDSITEGVGLANAAQESYPARLQRLLGTNYVVRNYGISGRTLLKKGDYPYWKEAAYTQSRNWGPDVVIIKLGTNDSKPYNWKYGTNYVSEFEDFIASYASLASHPRIVLCTPAPVYKTGAYDIKPDTVATNIAPSVRDLGARLGLEVIDFHARLAGHGEWFPDTVHPNTKGMAVMAAVVFAQITHAPPATEGPSLAAVSLPNRRAALRWPATPTGATFVLQSAPQFAVLTNTAWVVVDQVPYLGNDLIQITNTTTTSRFYRLWQP